MFQALSPILVALLLTLLARPGLARGPLTGPLAEYVAAKDESYQWTKRSEGSVLTCRYSELILTSQTWKGIPWKHQLFLLRPAQVDPKATHALFMIAGGNWNDKIADPATHLKLPGEALVLVAYTFREFLKTGDFTLPLLAPMTKSAVRGMDAAQDAMKKEWNLDIATFTITGASKRGWTTWLTGAVDDRAVAVAPMVIDMLNMSKHTKLQRASFGGQPSEQIDEYRGLDQQIDTPRGAALRKIVDPWEYRERLDQPKLIILATNDRYWPLNSADLYWNDLVGEKHLIYVPNNGHGIEDRARLIAGLAALNRRITAKEPLPKLDWQFSNGGGNLKLNITSDMRPSRVHVWRSSSQTLDFRESRWTSTPAQPAEEAFAHHEPLPASGYSAILGEAVFNEGTDQQFWLSTNVRILSPTPAAE
jgi:PhoPQ-activated pathogenicity-related protein